MVLKNTSFKLDDVLLYQIDTYAVKHRMTRSEVIRLALQRFLEEESEKNLEEEIKNDEILQIKIEKGPKLF